MTETISNIPPAQQPVDSSDHPHAHTDTDEVGPALKPARPFFCDPFDYEVDAALFARVRGFVSTEETRYHLNGVAIEPIPPGGESAGALLIATDGHRLCVAHDESAVCRAAETIIVRVNGDFDKVARSRSVLPRRLGVAGASLERKSLSAAVLFCGDGPDESGGADSEKFRPDLAQFDALIDGTFPDWRVVFNKAIMRTRGRAEVSPAINTRYVASFAALSSESEAPRIRMFAAGEGEPIIVIGSDPRFLGVLMPLRSTQPAGQEVGEWTAPPWLRLDPLQADKAVDDESGA